MKVTEKMVAEAIAATDWAAIDAMTDEDIARQTTTSGREKSQTRGRGQRRSRRSFDRTLGSIERMSDQV